MASPNPLPLTEEQYLFLEREAPTKSEFHDGQMYSMAGGSVNHSLLAGQTIMILGREVPKGCRTFTSDLRVKVPSAGLYTYPDAGVFCGDPQFAGDQQDCILNPVLIVEVLSPSTEGYDRGKKFEWYRTIESFREYLVVHQDRRHVEYYSKQDDGSWLLRDHSGSDATVNIARLGAKISLAELYANALNIGD